MVRPKSTKYKNASWLNTHNHAKQKVIADTEKQRGEAL